ncbi:hypothetical protein [Vibrio sp. 10N.247.310.17]|uniref:hypothetical protein n=1 Tax=Vibrio sp. 10N.247.310.17 TaxID=3229979 RepID=UPI00354BC961
MTFSILDGAKSAIITYLLYFGLFGYIYKFSGNNRPYLLLNKYGVLLMFLSIISALAVISIAGESNNGFMLLLSRLVMSGDVFYMAYPNEVYKLFIPDGEWYVNLFFSPASWFGLVDESDVFPTLGYQLMSYHEGYDIFKGPNPRMNVFGLVYLGYYASFFYAFIAGTIVGVLRNCTYDYFTRSNTKILVYASLVYCATTLEVDYFLFLASIINVIVMSIFILLCKVIATCCLNKRY